MIWIRRLFTIPLGLALLVLLLLAVVLLEVSDTFLNPDYYPEELRKANIYEFALVDLATSYLVEARKLEGDSLPEGFDENPLVTIGLSNEEIVSSLNRAIPPAWVQSIVEQVFEEAGKYITGQRDEFAVTVRAGEGQVAAIVSEAKFLLRKANAYDMMVDELLTPQAKAALDQKLPFGLNITAEQLVTSAQRVAPKEWVQQQVEAVLDEVTPYVTGERDTFTIRVELAGRVAIAVDEIKDLLRQADAYELLYDEVIEPTIAGRLDEIVQLPFEITITEDEVVAALREVAPPEWVQEQVEAVIDLAGLYIGGETDSLSISINLEENKRAARRVIVDAVDRTLRETADRLPACTPRQLAQFTAFSALRSACLQVSSATIWWESWWAELPTNWTLMYLV